MRILALDLGKHKTVACDYKAETGRHRFVAVPMTPKALHDLNVDLARGDLREGAAKAVDCNVRSPRSSPIIDLDVSAVRRHALTKT